MSYSAKAAVYGMIMRLGKSVKAPISTKLPNADYNPLRTVSNLSTLPLQHVDVFVRSMRKRTRRYTDLSDQNAKGWNEGDRAEFAEGFKQYLVDSK